MKNVFSTRRFTTPNASWPFLLVAALLLVSTSAAAEYKLQPGDTLEVSVIGASDLKQRSLVGVDGDVVVPLVGQIRVAGLPVSEARGKIVQKLSNKVHQQPSTEGRAIEHLILPNEIVVTVAEYRPIYVNGDVAKPGEVPFRPGMTVRQAVAIAGGYDQMRFRLANPFLQAADVRSDYESLWAEFAAEQARIWRLRTELGEQGVRYAGNEAPIPAELSARFLQVETEHRKSRIADREKDKAMLQEAITNANVQLSTLADKKKADEEGSRADMEDFGRLKVLFQKGITANARLSETRRAALLSSDQLLQTIVEMANIERQRGEYSRQLEKIDSQSRIEDWRDLQDANLRLAGITARLRSAAEKLRLTGRLQSEFMQSGLPSITVYRSGDEGLERVTGGEDLELAPGDTVEVALRTPDIPGAGPPPKDAAAASEPHSAAGSNRK